MGFGIIVVNGNKLNPIDFIITRNKADFKGSFLPVLTAGEYLAI